MKEYLITKSLQTGIWCLTESQTPRAFSGDPNGGNVQALLDLIPKDKIFYLEILN